MKLLQAEDFLYERLARIALPEARFGSRRRSVVAMVSAAAATSRNYRRKNVLRRQRVHRGLACGALQSGRQDGDADGMHHEVPGNAFPGGCRASPVGLRSHTRRSRHATGLIDRDGFTPVRNRSGGLCPGRPVVAPASRSAARSISLRRNRRPERRLSNQRVRPHARSPE